MIRHRAAAAVVVVLGVVGSMLLAPSAQAASVSTNADANVWQTDGRVDSIAYSADGSVLYIGGIFHHLCPAHAATCTATTTGNVAIDYLAAITVATGAPITSWRPEPDDDVEALQLSADGTDLYLGGVFNTVGAHAHHKLGRRGRRLRAAGGELGAEHRRRGEGAGAVPGRDGPVPGRHLQEGEHGRPRSPGGRERLQPVGHDGDAAAVGPRGQRLGHDGQGVADPGDRQHSRRAPGRPGVRRRRVHQHRWAVAVQRRRGLARNRRGHRRRGRELLDDSGPALHHPERHADAGRHDPLRERPWTRRVRAGVRQQQRRPAVGSPVRR